MWIYAPFCAKRHHESPPLQDTLMTKRDTSMEFTVALTAADIAAFVREVGKARAPEGAEAEAPPLTERQKRVRRWIEVGHHIARLFVMFLVIWVKLDLDRLLDLYDPRSDKEKFTALLQGNWGPAPWDFIWLVDPLIPALAIFLYLWWALDRAKKALFKRWDLGDPNPYVTQAIAREEARKARVAALDDGAVPWAEKTYRFTREGMEQVHPLVTDRVAWAAITDIRRAGRGAVRLGLAPAEGFVIPRAALMRAGMDTDGFLRRVRALHAGTGTAADEMAFPARTTRKDVERSISWKTQLVAARWDIIAGAVSIVGALAFAGFILLYVKGTMGFVKSGTLPPGMLEFVFGFPVTGAFLPHSVAMWTDFILLALVVLPIPLLPMLPQLLGTTRFAPLCRPTSTSFQEKTYRLTPAGVEVDHPLRRQWVDWAAVRDVLRGKGHIFSLLASDQGLIFPVEAMLPVLPDDAHARIRGWVAARGAQFPEDRAV